INPKIVSYTDIPTCLNISPFEEYFMNSLNISDGLLVKNTSIRFKLAAISQISTNSTSTSI
ncbi:MAG: hypothetical protein N4A48_00395, partial [Tepidibacter sp.]|uniref:hypothetical protein n=1 Tax=Tepidibacter sp. TaxID=2529387 RepID=UPI0025D90BEC